MRNIRKSGTLTGVFAGPATFNYAVVLTLLPSVAVGLDTGGAGVAGTDAFVPSLSPSASPPTFWVGGMGWTVEGFTPEMLDMEFLGLV